MRQKNPKKYFKVLSCVIYTIINNYVCIDDLACGSKKLSEVPVSSGGDFKHWKKSYDKILGIGIPDLLMNLISCHGFLKNKDSVVILKYPKRILEYYFSKVFTLFECNTNNLAKLPKEVKNIIHAEDTENSDKFMTCTTKILSTTNTLKNLAINKVFHYSSIQREFNDKNNMIINIFSAYVEPLLKYINHQSLLQEGKLNIDAA